MNVTRVPQPITVPICAKHYRLVEDYIYEWQEMGATFRITIPKGFVADGASTPRFLWSATGLRPDGIIRAAAWLHDFIYRFSGALPENLYQVRLTSGVWAPARIPMLQPEADLLFKKVMVASGILPHRAWIAYLGVRSLGWISWNKNKKKTRTLTFEQALRHEF